MYCRRNITGVILENAMLMLCHTAETRSKEQPSRYTRAEKTEIYFFGAFLTSTTFRPKNGWRSVFGPSHTTQADAPGGRLCFSFSAFSGSSSDNVYK